MRRLLSVPSGVRVSFIGLTALALGACKQPQAAPAVELRLLLPTPGLSSSEAETSVVIPIERAVGATAGLTRLRSRIGTAGAEVQFTAAAGTEPGGFATAVREKLNGAGLPSGSTPLFAMPRSRAVLHFTVDKQLRAALASDVAIRALRIDGVNQRPHMRVQLDRNLLAQHGLAAADVHGALATATTGTTLGTLKQSGEPLAVVLRTSAGDSPGDSVDLPTVLPNLRIKNRDGVLVPLQQVVSLSRETQPAPLLREQGQRSVRVRVTAPGLAPAALLKLLQDRVRMLPLPAGVALRFEQDV